MAQALAARHYDVVIAGRSQARGQAVLEQLHRDPNSQHQFVAMNGFDLKSMKESLLSIHTSAGEGKDALRPAFDVVVLSQGMATLQGYQPTQADGIDEKMQLHYFSRVYACLVLGQYQMLKPSSRVMTVLSAGIHSKYKKWEQDFELKDHYSIRNAADAAGFYTDAGFESLAQKFSGVSFCHAAPGFVATSWGSEMPYLLRQIVIRPMQKLFAKSATECGETLTTGLLQLESNGGFHLMNEHGQLIDSSKGVKHTEMERDQIWEKTLALLPDV